MNGLPLGKAKLRTQCRKPIRGGKSYGRIRINGRSLLLHRVIYEMTYGKIPDGLQVHHKCGNKRCINPKHMQLLTLSDHRRLHRRIEPLKTHCKWGHELSGDNVRLYWKYDGSKIRTCVKCQNIRNAKRKPGSTHGKWKADFEERLINDWISPSKKRI